MLLCACFSSAILNALPIVERYLKWLGALYIIWLAIGILRSDFSLSEESEMANPFMTGIILQLFNPKSAVYGLTLYSTFLAPISHRVDYLAVFAIIFAFTAFVSASVWALCGAAIKNKMKNDSFRRAVNMSLALLLVYTAIDISGVL